MANLDLFDKRGKFTAPSPEALATLTDTRRANVARVSNAAQRVEDITVAIAANELATKEVQAEIAALEKLVPRQTRIDLVKQMCRETVLRRSGRL